MWSESFAGGGEQGGVSVRGVCLAEASENNTERIIKRQNGEYVVEVRRGPWLSRLLMALTGDRK